MQCRSDQRRHLLSLGARWLEEGGLGGRGQAGLDCDSGPLCSVAGWIGSAGGRCSVPEMELAVSEESCFRILFRTVRNLVLLIKYHRRSVSQLFMRKISTDNLKTCGGYFLIYVNFLYI